MDIKSLPAPNIEHLQKWGPKVASVLLVVAIAYMLTQLVWRVIGDADMSDLPVSDTGQKTQQAQKQAAKFANDVSSRHLFGQANAQQTGDVIAAPETKLNLDLLGILAIGEKDGLAIIAGSGSEEKVYKVGDQIPGNVTLKAVYPDRVLLESSRGLETLMLPKEASLVDFVDTRDRDIDSVDNSSDSYTGKQADQGEYPEVTPKQLDDYRTKLSRNPAEIQKMADISPAMDDGKVIGYTLRPGPDAAMYKALGLQEGDVVTSVNGIDLSKPENSIMALQKLRRAKDINATILRDGQEIQINHSLR